jgi:hypothetical protein
MGVGSGRNSRGINDINNVTTTAETTPIPMALIYRVQLTNVPVLINSMNNTILYNSFATNDPNGQCLVEGA